MHIHWAVTLFFMGHALVHAFEIAAGVLPHEHWSLDAPSVFAPAILLIILGLRPVRDRLGENEEGILQ